MHAWKKVIKLTMLHNCIGTLDVLVFCTFLFLIIIVNFFVYLMKIDGQRLRGGLS